MSRDGMVRMEVGFAAGFAPQDRLLTLQHTTQKGAWRALWLLDANEPVPTGRRVAFRVACADRYAQPGETVLHIGNLASWDVKARFDLALCEGDELHPACPWPADPSGWHAKGETWALYWHDHLLGRIHLFDRVLRAALAGAAPYVVRIVRLGAGMRSDRDGLVFAIYRSTEDANG